MRRVAKLYPIFLLVLVGKLAYSFGGYLPAPSQGYANSKATGTIFDSNCTQFAKQNKLVWGTLEASQRTERYFVYDRILPLYKKTVAQVSKDLQTATPPSAVCNGETDVQKCLGFQSYCMDQIAAAGLTEDKKKWEDIVTNCSSIKYVERHPTHCQKDSVAALNFVLDQARRFANLNPISADNQARDPATAHFFKSAVAEFTKFKDKMESLLARANPPAPAPAKGTKAGAVAAAPSPAPEPTGSYKEVKKIMDQCQGVVAQDDNDVQNRGLALNAANGIVASCKDERYMILADSLGTDTTGASALMLNLEKVSRSIKQDDTLEKILDTALEKTLDGFWGIERRYNGMTQPDLVGFVCNGIPSLCKDPRQKAKIQKMYTKWAANPTNQAIQQITAEEKVAILDEELNPIMEEFNAACKARYDQWRDWRNTFKMLPVNEPSESLKISPFAAPPPSQMTQAMRDMGFQPIKSEAELKKEAATIFNAGDPNQNPKKVMLRESEERKRYKKEAQKMQGNLTAEMDQYSSALSRSNFGNLFFTKQFQDKVGKIDMHGSYTACQYSGKMYNKATIADVDKGMQEFRKLMIAELERIDSEINRAKHGDAVWQLRPSEDLFMREKKPAPVDTKTPREEIIKDYIKRGPLTIGLMLAENPDPETAKYLCELIREINSSDHTKQMIDKALIGVGAVATVAAAAATMGGSLAVEGAFISAVGVGARVTSVATTLAYGVSQSMEMMELDRQISRQQLAAVSGQTPWDEAFADARNLAEQRKALGTTPTDLMIDLFKGQVIGWGVGKVVSILSRNVAAYSLVKKAVRGKLGTADSLGAGELIKISNGLVKTNTLTRKAGLPPGFLNTLTPEEITEMGAYVGNFEKTDLLRIFQLAKKTGGSPLTILRTLRQSADGTVDFVKLETALARSAAGLKTAGGQSMLQFTQSADAAKMAGTTRSARVAESRAVILNTPRKSIDQGVTSIQTQITRNQLPSDVLTKTLHSDEILEAGALASRLKPGQLDKIFAIAKNAKYPTTTGRALLDALRTTKDEFNIARIESVFANAAPTIRSSVVRIVPASVKRWWSLPLPKKVVRAFIKERPPAPMGPLTARNIAKQAKERGWSTLQGQDIDPVSLASRNRWVTKKLGGKKYQLTMGPSIALSFKFGVWATYYAWSEGRPERQAKKEAAEKEKTDAENLTFVEQHFSSIPGSEYGLGLRDAGLIDSEAGYDLNAILTQHAKDFEAWMKDPESQDLPRLGEIADQLGLSGAEKTALNTKAKEIFNTEKAGYLKETGKEIDPKSDDYVALVRFSIAKLYDELSKDPLHFRRYTPDQISIMSSIYFPVFDILDKTDVERQNELYTSDTENNRRILRMMGDAPDAESGLPPMDIEAALEMQTMYDLGPEALKPKLAKAWNELPRELIFVANRPDLVQKVGDDPDGPMFTGSSTEYKPVPGQPAILLKDEIDRWKIIATSPNPMFKEIFDLVKKKELGEYQALVYFERITRNQTLISNAIEERKKGVALSPEKRDWLLLSPDFLPLQKDIQERFEPIEKRMERSKKTEEEILTALYDLMTKAYGIQLDIHDIVLRQDELLKTTSEKELNAKITELQRQYEALFKSK